MSVDSECRLTLRCGLMKKRKSASPRPRQNRHNEGARLLREHLGSDRGRLAALARQVGVHQGTMSHWRSGDRSPETKFRVLLREACDIPILSWDEPERGRDAAQ